MLHFRQTFVIAALASCCCTAAQAQVVAHYTSLEALVGGAESVVLGTIRETSRGALQCKFKVSIHEVLKGTQIDEAALTARTPFQWETFKRFDEWRDAHTQFLVFLRPKVFGNATESDSDWLMIRQAESVPAEHGYKLHAPPIFSMDFRVLKSRNEILTAAREAVVMFDRPIRKPVEFITVPIPRGIAQKCRPSGDFNEFTVPVVEEMRVIADKMMKTPEDLDKDFALSEYQPAVLWASGLKIVERFNSERNP